MVRSSVSAPEFEKLPNVKTLEISELILTAMVLIAKRNQEVTAAAKPGITKEPKLVDGGPKTGKPFGSKCFNCWGPHLIRYCKEPIRTICYML